MPTAKLGCEKMQTTACTSASGNLLDVEPARANYPHQQVYIVALEGYAYMVPHVDEGDTWRNM